MTNEAAAISPVEVSVPLAFYQWLATIESDVRVWDLTPHEIKGLIAALASMPGREALLKAERERCAKVAESFEPRTAETPDEFLAACEVTQDIAQAIRSLPPVDETG